MQGLTKDQLMELESSSHVTVSHFVVEKLYQFLDVSIFPRSIDYCNGYVLFNSSYILLPFDVRHWHRNINYGFS